MIFVGVQFYMQNTCTFHIHPFGYTRKEKWSFLELLFDQFAKCREIWVWSFDRLKCEFQMHKIWIVNIYNCYLSSINNINRIWLTFVNRVRQHEKFAKPRKSAGCCAPIIIVGKICWIFIGNKYQSKLQTKSQDSSYAVDTRSPYSQYKKIKPNGQNSWMIKLSTTSGLKVASDWKKFVKRKFAQNEQDNRNQEMND